MVTLQDGDFVRITFDYSTGNAIDIVFHGWDDDLFISGNLYTFSHVNGKPMRVETDREVIINNTWQYLEVLG